MRKHHRSKRGKGGFEAHRRDRGSADVRQGRAWRFMTRSFDPFDPHARKTARIQALPGAHVRQVKEPVRAAHGRIS